MNINRIQRYLKKDNQPKDKLAVIDLNFNINIDEENQFNSEWLVWYHHLKNNWKLDGYRKVFVIRNIKDFWNFHNNINIFGGLSGQHFFIMRKGSKPIWEDETNKNGGSWSIKIPNNKCYDLWIKLAGYMCGETLVDEPLLINGISICIKNSISTVIKIWNNDKQKNSVKLLPNDILNEFGYNIIYKTNIPEY